MSSKLDFKKIWPKLHYLVCGILMCLAIELFRIALIARTGDVVEDYCITFTHWLALACLLLPILGLLPSKLRKLADWCIIVITPTACFFLLEYITQHPTDVKPSVIACNLLVLYAVGIFLVFLFGRTDIPMILLLLLSVVFPSANYYVLLFRGSPILPWDLSAIGTALNVADRYTFLIYPSMGFIIAIAFIFICLNLLCNKRVKFKLRFIRPCAGVVSLAAVVWLLLFLQTTKAVSVFGLSVDVFDPPHTSRDNGLLVNFIMNVHYLYPDVPSSYSDEKLQQLYDDYEEVAADSQAAKPDKIIVIMNESFSDLSVVSNFETNQEVLPFINSLSDSTISGNLHVSIRGGGTCNSEFEFLTGMSMAFLPSGTYAYYQFIHQECPTLVSQLSAQGYKTVAMHPCEPTNWCRNNVYEYFGFDESCFQDFFADSPSTNDYDVYDKVLEVANESDEPTFIFCVTIQNHGNYETAVVPADTYIKGMEDNISVSNYMSLLHESDRALEHLITELEASDENVLLLFFGDHQPNGEIINPLVSYCGTIAESGTTQYTEQYYITPYLFWANYDIDLSKAPPQDMSANYLSSVLLEIANLPETKYNSFALQMLQEYPIINSQGFIDTQWQRVTKDDYSDVPILSDYACLQYNYLFGKRLSGFWEYN